MSDVRPSIYDYVGGEPAFAAFASALHERCLEDPVLNHPFSHPAHPQHLEHLAGYLGEVFGGPPRYSKALGGHSAMLIIHANAEAEQDLAMRFIECFVTAADDVGLPQDQTFRDTWRAYITWAVTEVYSYSPSGSVVPDGLAMPRWGWDGLRTDVTSD
ncbi:MAG: group II truncated hemoglobin [Acidimicrobiales bacterium]